MPLVSMMRCRGKPKLFQLFFVRNRTHSAYDCSFLQNGIYWNDKHEPNESKFDKVLIANRGEIACRIIETCKRIGIRSVVVHSEADAMSRSVAMADEAICVGPAPSSQSYLNIPAILDAVKVTGAQAVHPGYGFLSENTHFAVELEKNNVTFLGPNSKSIQSMGDKIESKRIATVAKINCIPGYNGVVKDQDESIKIANEIGYPIMIKASAGGGGKGMRVAWNDKQTRDGYELSKSEAASSFGDDRMLIEKFIDNPRHIEIQILCDKYGNGIFLNERECSIQRRNQKVIEEAPSTFLDEATRQAMGDQALALAKAVGYDSAGTVEFLVDSKRNFYFLEMNTRLQVEHPITECITGVDIVHQMLRIGKGHPLLLKQSDIQINGWALECRVYAEDPYKSFGLPSIGRLYAYQEPTHLPNVRCDSGIDEGAEISIYYDPMICKLVTYGPNRAFTLTRMAEALDNYVIRGVTHNVPLLRDIITEPRFVSGNITTNYLTEVYPDGFKGKSLNTNELHTLVSVGASVFVKDNRRNFSQCQSRSLNWDLIATVEHSHASPSPIGPRYIRCIVEYDESKFTIKLLDWSPPVHITTKQSDALPPALYKQELDKQVTLDVVNVLDNFLLSDKIIHHRTDDNINLALQLVHKSVDTVTLQYQGTLFPIRLMSTKAAWYKSAYMPSPKQIDQSAFCIAPMPGLLNSINVTVGEQVTEGQQLCVLEAMKMQNSLTANRPGIVKKVNFERGDSVAEGDLLIELSN